MKWAFMMLFLGIAAYCLYWQLEVTKECEARGGVAVKGVWSIVCVQGSFGGRP